jgi:PAS domain S-box-containing protein
MLDDLSGYVLETLREGDELVLYRGRQQGNRPQAPAQVLVVAPVSAAASATTLERLEHEYRLASELDSAWAVRPLALVRHEQRVMLVLEDPGGESIDRLAGRFRDVGELLRVAIALAGALGQMHQRGLVHKDIKPPHVLLDAAGHVRLTGFGIASRVPRERQDPGPPEIISGTLAYMAPEQTGRMNRSIDARSDLYACGVTLYEMLTGALPFSASDPMEWIHCHVARSPTPPDERAAGIPAAVSAIVMKLLAKNAEDRYQTAVGLDDDLRRCLAAWESVGRIDPFPLGTHDVPDRLLIPEKLYGREREIESLLAAFGRVVDDGVSELVLISGYAGIGKSSVVHELHRTLVSSGGLFASGKFDQARRDIPYATLAQAFRSLVLFVLSQSEIDLARWRHALRSALGVNGQLLVDLIPELELVIGEQPPVLDLPPQDAQNRYRMVFQRFVSVFARPEHPLALFLDDLQWLDAGTLDLLEHLVGEREVGPLLLVGAYRDHETSPSHPLIRALARIRQRGIHVGEIALPPLGHDDLGRFIADALHCERRRVAPLAALVHEKTGGNPFFVIQFVRTLVEEGLVAFDPAASAWAWDLERIRAKGYTDNVVDFVVGKLARLSGDAQDVLTQLACLGNSAPVATLNAVCGRSDEAIALALEDAVRSEFVFRADGAYTFLHDRVQEAAYALIPEGERAATHLRIGRLLAEDTPPQKQADAVFDIVGHFNRGAGLITSREERGQVASLNLAAGRRARTATAYVSALRYFGAGAALLAEEDWTLHYPLTFALEFHRAECEFLTGDLAAADGRLSMLSNRAATPVDCAAVTCLRVVLYTTLDRPDRAIEVGLEYLRDAGIDWPVHPTADALREEYARIWQQLGNRPIEALVDLPLMRDPHWHAAMDVLIEMVTPAVSTDPHLVGLIVGRMTNLSLEHGNSDASCFAYVHLAMVLGSHFGDYRAGFRFGALALDLVDTRGLDGFKARVYKQFGAHVNPWTQHLRAGRTLVRRAFDLALARGDLSFAAYSCNAMISIMLGSGDPLADVQRETEYGIAFARTVGLGRVIDIMTTQLGLVRTLRGVTPRFGTFDEPEFDERRFEQRLEEDRRLVLPACWYWIRKLQACVFAGDYTSALDAAEKARPLLWVTAPFFEVAEYHFYAALARAGSCDLVSAEQRRPHLEAVAAHHRQLEVWTQHCPENFADRTALVAAEIARIEGREFEAMRLYEQAIATAREHGFIHHEALGFELAARFYAAGGFARIANAYMQEARGCYLRWGAIGKVRQLDELHSHLAEEEPVPGLTSTIGAPVEHLDLATVIKVSQTVSGEIVLGKLIDTLMRTALEHAGAARGLLILGSGAEQRIQAEATTSGDTVVVHLRDAPVANAVPESIVHYVARTRESVILDDASAPNPFFADPYIRRQHTRSVLCLPLVNRATLIGVLYLENNLAPRVFTPTRMSVLKVLASQAAISLENTRLYRDLGERDAKIRRLFDANIIGICIWNVEGTILEANEAFLHMVEYGGDDVVSGRVRWTDLTPVEWCDADKRAVAELKATGTFRPFEKEFFRKNGSRVPVLIGGATFEGRGEGVSFVLDLSEQKRTDEALRRSQVYLAEAQRLTHTGSWAGNIIMRRMRHSSEEHSRLYGFDPDIGSPSFDQLEQRIHPDDRARVGDAFRNASRTVSDVAVQYRIVLPDGTTRYVQAVGHPVSQPSGELGEFVGFLMDVTERRQADEERETLRQAQADLAHMTRVTTMGQLTASLAHEIKQPITAALTDAKTCLRWLRRDDPDVPEARDAASRMVKDVSHAADIISSISALFTKGALSRDLVDVNELIREMIGMLGSEANRYAIAVRTELEPDLPGIVANRVQLQQVLMNLMLNGIDAMKETDGEHGLSIKSEADHDQLIISVSDTGVGLPSEQPDQIFRAFFTTKVHGTGMGLSISRSIVESHGGRLWATGNSGRGATFHFSLPAGAAIVAGRDSHPLTQ